MKLREKLNSKKGASLIIALVFLLFCTFVGGAVLAAATANAGRVADLKNDQQDYLNQRSAALLLKDEMTLKNPVISVNENTVDKVQVEVLDGGVVKEVGEHQITTTVTLTVSEKATTPLERIFYETAIIRYLKENSVPDFSTITISGFTYQPKNSAAENITSVYSFWIYRDAKPDIWQEAEADMTVDLKDSSNASVTSIDAKLVSAASPSQSASTATPVTFSFYVDFGDNAQLNMNMMANVGENTVGPITVLSRENDNKDYRIVTTTKISTISWDSPLIEKGAIA